MISKKPSKLYLERVPEQASMDHMDQTDLQILLARQGIYDRKGEVYAYELLYRHDNEHQSNINNRNEIAGVIATSSVIAQLFSNVSIDAVLGDKSAFINFTYSDLVGKIPELLPADRVAIEVLETIRIDRQVISSVIDLHRNGYRIVLDDFEYRDELLPLLEIADIIKLDVLNRSRQEIVEQLRPLRGFKGKLLAEKIDTREQFQCCLDLGFDYFQGFFLNKPDVFRGQAITENKAQIISALSELNRDDISVDKLEQVILDIPRLCYRILRISNSVYYYRGRKNTSLSDAIFRLGLRKIRNWTNMLLLASNADTSPDLLVRTLIRAKMCESIARSYYRRNPHEAYTVGIFSTLDGMLNEPLASLLTKIQIDDNLYQALMYHDGELGQILEYVIAYEQANFHAFDDTPFSKRELASFYFKGIDYANTIIRFAP